jgi:hypothetical protein
MMTIDEIKTELARLNGKQRAALRARFYGMGITYLRCREFLGRVDGVHVMFEGGVHYDVWIGPRGALKSVECCGRIEPSTN